MRPMRRTASPSPTPPAPTVAAGDMLRILDEATAGTLPPGSWARWLATELREDLHARLDHAGKTPETAILLARVFTDIAASTGSSGDEDDLAEEGVSPGSTRQDDEEHGATPFGRALGQGVLTALLGTRPTRLFPKLERTGVVAVEAGVEHFLPKSAIGDARRRWRDLVVALRSTSLSHHMHELRGDVDHYAPRRGTIEQQLRDYYPDHEVGSHLLIGAPGQGKSTLSQFLCQMHRAEILPAQVAVLDADARSALRAFEEDAIALRFPKPAHACLPLRIVLRDLAAWMFREKQAPERALAAFLAARMARSLGVAVPVAAVLSAIARVPWLLVLDGLDEVPVSGGRAELLDAIHAFLACDEASLAPRLVVATTRPQGYAGELGDFASLHLLGMSRRRMLGYATRLVNARYPGNRERQSEILERLGAAWEETTGRHLLRTPLQVTLMADLAAQVGRIPGDRWKLFADYYRVMYMRETSRPNLQHAGLLDRLKTQITQLHQRAGLWLQVRSEQSGGTDALLSRDELRGLLDAVLAEDYEDAAARAALVEEVLNAAVERLVFLVQAQDGKYGFEIRSLQEWMAAEALLNGTDEDIKARLKHVAPVEAWRNVVLFAAGKCFAELFALADFVVKDLCVWLDEGCEIPEVRATLVGSELALDILEDGAAREQRGRARRLAATALRLLELPPAPVHRRLAKIGLQEFEEPLRKALDARLQEKEHARTLSAWVVLAALMDHGVTWAEELANTAWPPGEEERRAVVRAVVTEPGEQDPDLVLSGEGDRESLFDRWLLARVKAALADFPPEFLKGFYWKLHVRKAPAFGSFVSYMGYHYEGVEFALGVSHHGRDTGIRGAFWRMEDVKWDAEGISKYDRTTSGDWAPVIAAARFLQDPTVERLAVELRGLADSLTSEIPRTHAHVLPWPFAQALRQSRTPEDLKRLADQLDAGEYGRGDALIRAESQWNGRVEVEGLLDLRSFWPAPGTEGFRFPLQATFFFRTSPQGPFTPILRRATDVFRTSTGEKRYAAAWLIRELLVKISEDKGESTSGEAAEMLSAADVLDVMKVLDGRILWQPIFSKRAADSDVMLWVDVFDTIGHRWLPALNHGFAPRAAIDMYVSRPDKTGLLRLLAMDLNVEALDKLPPALLSPTRFTPGSLEAFCAALIRLRQAELTPDEEESLAAAMAGAWPESEPFSQAALNALKSSSSHFLLTLLPRLAPNHWSASAMAIQQLRRHRTQLRSSLPDSATCARLHLPAPPPPARSPSDPAPATGVFHLHAISFADLRPFHALTVELPSPAREPPDDTGQWMILIGENGVGKSTFLRGLVFALGDAAAATGAFAKSPAPYRRDPESTARIDVVSSTGSFGATISSDTSSGREILQFSRKNGGRRPFLVAYGCQRGSALGGPNQEASFASESDIVTLFDETRGLLHAEMWLTKLWVGARNDPGGPGAARFETVVRVLEKVLSLDTIDVQEDGVWVTGKGTDRARLAALSDGYLTTAGWVVDLMARWIDRARRLGQDIPERFNETMEGLVLVDEVDLHLHPRWQLRILADLRDLFPRLSFVVTTHHGLTLLGAREGEIFALVRDEKTKDIEARPLGLPRGLRADQVLTGEWFGLASTLDPDTLGLLEKHRQILRRGTPESDPERRSLEAELRERLGSFQETATDRLVQSVAAELIDETYREPTPEERAELRERIKRLARERLLQERKATQGSAE